MSRAKKTMLVNILGTNWEVLYRDFPVTADGTPNELFGYCCGEAFQVHINTLKSPRSHADTLLHECTHAMELMLGLAVDEERVRLISTATLQMLRANPKVAACLLK